MLILECTQGCYAVNIWPGDLDLWPWKSIGYQILLRSKYVSSLVKIHWRMLILECSQGCDGRTEGSVIISLRNFVGEGIINTKLNDLKILSRTYDSYHSPLLRCSCYCHRKWEGCDGTKHKQLIIYFYLHVTLTKPLDYFWFLLEILLQFCISQHPLCQHYW